MRTHEERRRAWSRHWSGGLAPKFIVKLLSLALLTCLLMLKPINILSQRKSDSPSTHNLDRRVNLDSLGDGLRKQQVARRTLLQANSRFRPTPTGYPPPGNNPHVAVPHAPTFARRPP